KRPQLPLLGYNSLAVPNIVPWDAAIRSGGWGIRNLAQSGRTITFWSSADFALIAGGIHSFVDSTANTHHLLMGCGNVDIAHMSELQAAEGREHDAPELPDFPQGNANY